MNPTINHEHFIQKSYELAERSVNNGNHPFGALLVYNDKVLMSSENTVWTDNDVTAHAELNLIRTSCQALSPETIKQATLYTSTEPCAMCAGAIFWAGISQVVFGCSAKAMSKHTTGSFIVPCQHLFDFGNRKMDVIGPILESQGELQHKSFWKSANP